MITTKLRIRTLPDLSLRQKSTPVKEVDGSLKVLIASMLETMYEGKGIGLAAPQVGVNERLFVADIGDGSMAFINPKIVKKSGRDVMEEGCLSLPGVLVKVKRPAKITAEYLDENNRHVHREFDGLLAKVVLHETDHLNGKLIIDYASWYEKLKINKQLREIQKKGASSFPANFNA